jgi:WW domain-binding protein 2
MALNPQLVSGWGQNGSTSVFPAPYAGEYICAQRDHSKFEIKGPRQYNFSGAGSVFLTNYRLVFVATKPTRQGVHAVEIPLLFISKEDIRQPVFGANNLRGVCRPVDASPGSSEEIQWKLLFTNGGMGTLVPLFYSCLEYLRVASRRRQPPPEEQAGFEPHAHDGAASVEHPQKPQYEGPPASKPPAFLGSALVDPSDPTTIFLTQPVATSAQAPAPKFPVV